MKSPFSILTKLGNRYKRTVSDRLGCSPQVLRPNRPVVSFCFDDYPVTALEAGGGILASNGVRGTYYAALGLLGKESPVGRIVDASQLSRTLGEGHELGCHTFSHCHSWDTPPELFEEAVVQNGRELSRLIPGATFRTLSYPLSGPQPGTKRRTASRFACCRGGGQTYNRGRVDRANLKAYFLEMARGDAEAVNRLIDETCRESGWLILATHDVVPNPSRFGVTPVFFEASVKRAISAGAQVLPVGAAWDLVSAGG